MEVIACFSVNDLFVICAWGQANHADGKLAVHGIEDLKFLAGGARTQSVVSYTILACVSHVLLLLKNGVVRKLFIESDGTGLTCSLAPNILSVI
ncbi:unnamed protein product [Lampetra planeri]